MNQLTYNPHPITKTDKHSNYIVWLKSEIDRLENESKEIELRLAELRQKLQDNENYTPEEDEII